MIRGRCNRCRLMTDDLSYPAGGLCPACRAPIERAREMAREDELRRRERAFHAARRELADFVRRDRIFDDTVRRLDLSDPDSVWHTIGVALQRGRSDFAFGLLAVARKQRWYTKEWEGGWERMIPDRL